MTIKEEMNLALISIKKSNSFFNLSKMFQNYLGKIFQFCLNAGFCLCVSETKMNTWFSKLL